MRGRWRGRGGIMCWSSLIGARTRRSCVRCGNLYDVTMTIYYCNSANFSPDLLLKYKIVSIKNGRNTEKKPRKNVDALNTGRKINKI
jgi:hypothetical protein